MRALAELASLMSDLGDTASAELAWARIERLQAAAGLPAQDRVQRRRDR
jgi:hypothetical protein